MKAINVGRITVIRGDGSDKVYFETFLTPSVWPWNDSPTARIEVAAGTAGTWLKENGFDRYTLIETDSGSRTEISL